MPECVDSPAEDNRIPRSGCSCMLCDLARMPTPMTAGLRGLPHPESAPRVAAMAPTKDEPDQ
jgi:hypothetical protein